ncbi:MAG: hypothetical protein ACPG19_12575 [Saprospiraceae bacterium]
MSDFKFGAKLRLFGDNHVEIKPNAEFPFLIEYRDEEGFAITRELVADKLNIKDPAIRNIIPEQTRITDVVINRKTKEFELGIVVEPGDDFALNKYKDILFIEEVAMFYKYDPIKGHQLAVEVDGHADKAKIQQKVVEVAVDVLTESKEEAEQAALKASEESMDGLDDEMGEE